MVTHHQKHPKHAQMDRSNDSLGSAHQGSDIRPGKVIVKLMLASHPDGPCPEPAKMYRCHLCQDYVGRKALISHLRNCHHIHRPDGFPFDPVHDIRIPPMLLIRFVCPGMLSQPLSLKSFYVHTQACHRIRSSPFVAFLHELNPLTWAWHSRDCTPTTVQPTTLSEKLQDQLTDMNQALHLKLEAVISMPR